jgi:hypothetical protein
MSEHTNKETRYICEHFADFFLEVCADFAAERGYHHAYEAAQEALVSELSGHLYTFVEEMELEQIPTPFTQGIVSEFLKQVNWREIAKEFLSKSKPPEPQPVTPATVTMTEQQVRLVIQAIEQASIVLQAHTEYDNPSDGPSAESEALNSLSEAWAVLSKQIV